MEGKVGWDRGGNSEAKPRQVRAAIGGEGDLNGRAGHGCYLRRADSEKRQGNKERWSVMSGGKAGARANPAGVE